MNSKEIDYKWKINENHHFVNYSNDAETWHETSNDGQTINFTYKQVSIENNQVILYDSTRNIYLKIIGDKMFTCLGNVKKIDRLIYSGKWTNTKTKSDAPLVQCEIKLHSLKSGDTFHHKLILIKGKIDCSLYQNIYLNSVDS